MKAVVFTLGCKVNSCESASLISGLEERGYEVSDKISYADLYIINTCAVTQEAEKKSRQAVARVKKQNPNAKIIVTGCASQNNPNSFYNKEGVTLVTGTSNKQRILDILDFNGVDIQEFSDTFDEKLPPKLLKTRAFVKIQDGCNNFCSYCLIPYLRGRSRSRSPISIKREIEYLNPLEIVLTAINLTAYDYNGVKLTGLINLLSDYNGRIRLGSLEENVISDEFLTELSKLKDFAPHFHLSLQSGSDNTLKSMNRKYKAQEFIDSVKLIRKYFKNAGITTDIIVGFPTETEEDFIKTLNFVNEVKFSDIHCFPYSPRQGTKSYQMKDLPSSVKKDRLNRLIEVKNRLKSQFILDNLGKETFLITEEFVDGYTVGYTGNYIKCYLKGQITDGKYKVKLISVHQDGAICEIV